MTNNTYILLQTLLKGQGFLFALVTKLSKFLLLIIQVGVGMFMSQLVSSYIAEASVTDSDITTRQRAFTYWGNFTENLPSKDSVRDQPSTRE